MKLTTNWLRDHLTTNKSENQIIDKLNNIGLEVEKVETITNELSNFIVAKILKAEKHPNADRLKLCKVDIGNNKMPKLDNYVFIEDNKKLLSGVHKIIKGKSDNINFISIFL